MSRWCSPNALPGSDQARLNWALSSPWPVSSSLSARRHGYRVDELVAIINDVARRPEAECAGGWRPTDVADIG